jgi:hypothetical protein
MSNPDPSVVKPAFQDESSSRVEPWFAGPEKNSSISSFDWQKPGDKLHMNGAYDSSDLLSSLLERPSELNGFSSSLPALLHEKCEYFKSYNFIYLTRTSLCMLKLDYSMFQNPCSKS